MSVEMSAKRGFRGHRRTVTRHREVHEEHFVLRVKDPELVRRIQNALNEEGKSDDSETEDSSKDTVVTEREPLDIKLVFEGPKRGKLLVNGESFPVGVARLPTAVESFKTLDDMHCVKLSRVNQILIVGDKDVEEETPDGITPPFRNVRERFFKPQPKFTKEDVAHVEEALLSIFEGWAPAGWRFEDTEEQCVVEDALDRVYGAPFRGHTPRSTTPTRSFVRRRAAEMQTAEGARDAKALGELLIVGPGVLGSYLAKLWIERGGAVTGRTNTTTHHARLKTLGVVPETYEDAKEGTYAHVVYSAPASGSSDYPESIRAAAERWDGSGSFVFTSSTGIYPAEGVITEDTPPQPLSAGPRMERMINAEEAALECGGNVVRLGGLYHAKRGPHTFAISKGAISRPPNHSMTLIHYQDAARLVFEVLLKGADLRKETLLAVEGGSVTWRALVDAALASGLFDGDVAFDQDDAVNLPLRRFDNSKTVELLSGAWKPEFQFEPFMRAGGEDWYTTSGLW